VSECPSAYHERLAGQPAGRRSDARHNTEVSWYVFIDPKAVSLCHGMITVGEERQIALVSEHPMLVRIMQNTTQRNKLCHNIVDPHIWCQCVTEHRSDEWGGNWKQRSLPSFFRTDLCWTMRNPYLNCMKFLKLASLSFSYACLSTH
jgi:hypothetical protein